MKYYTVLLIVVFSGCATYIRPSSTLFKITPSPAMSGIPEKLEVLTVKDKTKAAVKVDGDKVFVTVVKPIVYEPDKNPVIQPAGFPKDPVRSSKSNVYYLSNDALVENRGTGKLKYFESTFGVQALAVALKVRSKQDVGGVNYPYQVESGSSYGIGAGYKLSWNTFSLDKNIWGSNVNTFSTTFGGFVSLGTAGIKASTNAPGLVKDFTGLIWSPGVFVQLGYNNINIGYALGPDYLFGEGSGSWIYQGKVWNGLIVSINVAKF